MLSDYIAKMGEVKASLKAEGARHLALCRAVEARVKDGCGQDIPQYWTSGPMLRYIRRKLQWVREVAINGQWIGAVGGGMSLQLNHPDHNTHWRLGALEMLLPVLQTIGLADYEQWAADALSTQTRRPIYRVGLWLPNLRREGWAAELFCERHGLPILDTLFLTSDDFYVEVPREVWEEKIEGGESGYQARCMVKEELLEPGELVICPHDPQNIVMLNHNMTLNRFLELWDLSKKS